MVLEHLDPFQAHRDGGFAPLVNWEDQLVHQQDDQCLALPPRRQEE